MDDTNPCRLTRCENGGTCYYDTPDVICRCRDGYTGDRCQTGNTFHSPNNDQGPISMYLNLQVKHLKLCSFNGFFHSEVDEGLLKTLGTISHRITGAHAHKFIQH